MLHDAFNKCQEKILWALIKNIEISELIFGNFREFRNYINNRDPLILRGEDDMVILHLISSITRAENVWF